MSNLLQRVFELLRKEHQQEYKKHYTSEWNLKSKEELDPRVKSRLHWYDGDVEVHPRNLKEDAAPELGHDFVHARIDRKDLSKAKLSPGLIKHYQQHQASLKGVQKEAINDYKTGQVGVNPTHDILNRNLRSGHPHSVYFKALDEHLSSVMKPIPESHHVYRGIGDLALTRKMRELKPGDTFTDKGYVSTSLSPKKAVSFSSGTYADRNTNDFEHLPEVQRKHPKDVHYYNTVMKIHLPAGTKAHYLDINHHQKNDKDVMKSPSGTKEYGDEREVLLNKGMKYKILGHSIQKSAFSPTEHLHIIHARAMPE